MGWIACCSSDAGWQDLAGDPSRVPDPGAGTDFLTRGTLRIETQIAPGLRPKTLLQFQRSRPCSGVFSLQVLPSGGIILVDAEADDVRHATLAYDPDGRLDVVRLTYSWDTATGWARLTLEHPATTAMHATSVDAPPGLSISDIKLALRHDNACEMHDDVTLIAISDEVEPVGPMPSLTADVPILTREGEVPISDIRRGDVVITETGQAVPVLQVVKRTVPALGTFQPIRLRAPYFSLGRDIFVAPSQRLVMQGSQVEYMFGREAVLVPARHLINDRSAFYAKGPGLVTYYQLLLPGHEVMIASGALVESLYVGRLRRDVEAFGQSVLSDFDRARLPEHAKPVLTVLKPFEAVTLATIRAA